MGSVCADRRKQDLPVNASLPAFINVGGRIGVFPSAENQVGPNGKAYHTNPSS